MRRPLNGETPTIDLVVGKANTSQILRPFLSKISELIPLVEQNSIATISCNEQFYLNRRAYDLHPYANREEHRSHRQQPQADPKRIGSGGSTGADAAFRPL